ncbi:DUF4271 domain-containing protein [Leptobacterium flavescens]|uniref:DUF4271 domain-containing protein n=1 Tax=Leptobacterium flavescens TaxID=472055 RepID=A0A6P0UVZ2_9FLAO|nr:DUF4271 domain-containing protein [Leptobacterium flavescens]NER14596.1 DUF4271 domain-containing protein [Leptobacterium flavescens]
MEVISRHIESNTVETLLLLSCFALITIVKVRNELRFQTFLELFFSNKYLKIYGKEHNLNFSSFNILLFLVQIIVFGFFLHYVNIYFEGTTSFHIGIIISAIALLVLFKYYFEKLIANIFNIEFFSERYNFHKLSYRSLISIVLLPFITLLIYSPLPQKTIIVITIGLFLLLNTTAFILTLKNHQKLILNRLFYFILYLCALEIAPYLIAFKLVF